MDRNPAEIYFAVGWTREPAGAGRASDQISAQRHLELPLRYEALARQFESAELGNAFRDLPAARFARGG
jgi:hypothetical protein